MYGVAVAPGDSSSSSVGPVDAAADGATSPSSNPSTGPGHYWTEALLVMVRVTWHWRGLAVG